MQVTSRVWIFVFLSVFLFCSVSQALTLGTNITIWDGMGTAPTDGSTGEDNEAEPGCVQSQAWDMEGFFLKGSTLTMVGGYDFVNGVTTSTKNFASGDIFIDVGKTGSSADDGSFGYDYVLDIDFAAKEYSVIQLFDTSTTLSITTDSVYYTMNDMSNPWKYDSGGALVAGLGNISFADSYWAGLSDAEVANLSSWGAGDSSHYAAAFDLSFLAPNTEFLSHFTMECGNDNLMGRGTAPVPEPATIVLMGIGLLGLFGLRRMKR